MMYCSYVLFAFRLLLVAILAQSRHGLSSRVCHPAHLPHASRIMPLSQWSSSQQMISMSGQINPALLGRKYHGTRRELGIQYKRHLLIACTGYLVYCRRLLMSSWLWRPISDTTPGLSLGQVKGEWRNKALHGGRNSATTRKVANVCKVTGEWLPSWYISILYLREAFLGWISTSDLSKSMRWKVIAACCFIVVHTSIVGNAISLFSLGLRCYEGYGCCNGQFSCKLSRSPWDSAAFNVLLRPLAKRFDQALINELLH
jgi:hypothetical protein